MDFRVLGPVAVVDGGKAVVLGGSQQRRLLALLLTNAGRVIPVDRIADGMWPDDHGPRDSVAVVHTYVARLRRAIGAATIETVGPGYRFVAARSLIDSRRFEELVVTARSAGDVDSLATLDKALALWTGPPLADFAEEWWARPEVERLEELWLAASEQRTRVLINLGRYEAAVADLRPLIAAHPLRQRLVAELMTALSRAGRQAEALRSFRNLRAALAEAGLEPNTDLVALDRSIASGTVVTALRGSEPHSSGNLPLPRFELTGRHGEIARIVDLIAPGRVVTLTGTGGVGKTQLALACARASTLSLPDGAWLISLATALSGEDVAPTAMTDLELMPAAPSDGDTVARQLGDQHRLIVVDNCEQVLPAARSLIEQILNRCPNVAVLATSREPLLIIGERIMTVNPLSIERLGGASSAASLFTTRVTEADPTFVPDSQSLQTIEEICVRLDGLPLALELAAARVRALGLGEVRSRIIDHIDPFTRRAPPERHESLTAVVAWSYNLLSQDERTVFERLSIFSDGFELQAAIVVAGAPPVDGCVEDILIALIDKSLVVVEPTKPVRYRQLEMVRQYAAERLELTGSMSIVTSRFVDYYVRWLAEADAGSRGPDEAAWDTRLRTEWGNVRRAVQRAVTLDDVDAAASLLWHSYWWASQRSRLEVGDWVDAVTTMASFGASILQPVVLAIGADVARRRVDYDSFQRLIADAEKLEAETGPASEPIVPYVAIMRDAIYSDRDPSPAAAEVARRAGSSTFWTAAAAWGDAYMASVRASNARTAQDLDPNDLERIERCVSLAEATHNPSLIARSLELHGSALRRTDPTLSVDVLSRSLRIAAELGNEEVTSFTRVDLAMVLTDLSRIDEAVDTLLEGLHRYRRIGAHTLVWDMVLASFRPLVALGAHESATHILGRARAASIVQEWMTFYFPSEEISHLIEAVGQSQLDAWETDAAAYGAAHVVDEVAAALMSVPVRRPSRRPSSSVE